MKLIKPSYEIITPINGEEILKQIELAARTCYKSEGKIEYQDIFVNADKDTDPNIIKDYYAKSARVLIPKLMNLNHEAMLEFGGMITVRFIVDRGVSHELVRHRVASFAQESTRYCNYGKDEHIQFIIPCWMNIDEQIITTTKLGTIDRVFYLESNKIKNLTYTSIDFDYMDCLALSEYNYNLLLSKGWSPQEARSVLPNSVKTEINVSANIREWRHIFKLRTSKAAHPQMRELMCPLLDEFKQRIPILFDDINY